MIRHKLNSGYTCVVSGSTTTVGVSASISSSVWTIRTGLILPISRPQAGAVGEWPEGLYQAEMRVAVFQNGYYVALCNRVGREDCLEFAGESFVCAPDGAVIARAGQGTEEIRYAEVDLVSCGRSHARQLFLRHRRPELYGAWLTR